MIKILIILCCEVLTGSNGYSYLVEDTSNENYTLTMYTKQKYEIGDTVKLTMDYKPIDWKSTRKQSYK
jgi:hypothetical protein|tara:strand:- start:1174 stop:1377 length:204 start_codon:yes stop_codon:yes gene_type:complete